MSFFLYNFFMIINKTKLWKLKNKKIFLKLIEWEGGINPKNPYSTIDKLITTKFMDKATKEMFDLPKENTRMITVFNNKNRHGYNEYMKKLKRFDKLLKATFDFGEDNFITSTIKKTSNILNAKRHISNNFFFSVDLKDFFTNIKFSKIKNMFEKRLNVSNDLAALMASIVTVKNNDGERILPQGFPTSPMISLLCTYGTFKKLNNMSSNNSITFSAYVDDLTFSKKTYIDPNFINSVFSILEQDRIKINRNKTIVKRISLYGKPIIITGIGFKSDKIFPYYKSDKFYVKNYLGKMDTILKAIIKFDEPILTKPMLRTLFESYNFDGDIRGSLFKKYQGYFTYVNSFTGIVPKKMRKRRFRTWIKYRNYFLLQFNEISKLNHILNKRAIELSFDEIKEIKKTLHRIRIYKDTVRNKRDWQQK